MASIEFTLDGETVEASPGETILDVARRNGKWIPTLCHDPRIEPFTSCFVCLVEMEGKPGYVPSCATRAAPGMNIVTDSPQIREARKLCLELLMSAHYADCVAPCRLQCPDNIDIQTYIAQIAAGDFAQALKTIKRTNPFPSVCGRVCPHSCELQCRRNKVDEAVAINPLKRFVADRDLESAAPFLPEVEPDSGKRVAVVGGGPAGLTSAYYLRQKGHQVTVFEMNDKPGGMLRFGIPYYRLPADSLDREIDQILALGVELRCGQKLGRDFDLQKLKADGFDAIFLGLGAWTSSSMRVEGENEPGVMTGIDYLYKVAAGEPCDLGKRVVVVGGGNTAVDAARTAKRAGSEVTILYRRTRAEMPAEDFEVDEAEAEGVAMHFLAAPVGLPGKGRVERIRAIRMELGEPDASGRRRPVPIDGSEFEIEIDTVIAAIGQKPDPSCWLSEGGPESTRWNTVEANERTFQTAVPWIFTAGDCLTGAATAIEAIAGGRKAALSIDRYLRGLELLPFGKPFSDTIGRLEDLDDEMFKQVKRSPRVHGREVPVAERMDNFEEVELGIDQAQALTESMRCLECGCSSVDTCTLRGLCEEYDVDLNRFEVNYELQPVLDDHPFVRYDPNKCILCGRCVRICLEQQGLGALGFVNRGFETSIQPSMGQALLSTDCDSCGQCINSCPSGALEAKLSLPKSGPYQPDCTQLVCGFCGVACRLTVETDGGHYVQTSTEPGAFHNRGNLCVDGAFGHRYLDTLDRVQNPRIRTGKTSQDADWVSALAKAAEGLIKAGKKTGVAVLVNGAVTNEEAYLLGRLVRTRLGRHRLALLDEAADLPAPSKLEFADLEKADAIWVVGGDPFEIAPVAAIELRRAARAGAQLSLFASRPGRLDAVASRSLRVSGESMSGLISALADHASKPKPKALAEAALAVHIKPGVLAAALDSLKEAKRPLVVLDDSVPGDVIDAVLRLLAGIKRSERLFVLRRVGNSLGRKHMGLAPGHLPGGCSATDKRQRKKIETLWGEPLTTAKIEPASAVLDAVRTGKVGAVLVVNADPYGLPLVPGDIHEKVFSVGLDVVPGTLTDMLDVLLPSGTLAESHGTVTGMDNTVLPTRATVPSAGGKNLFQVIGALADAMGRSLPIGKPEHVWAELQRLDKKLGVFAAGRLGLTGERWMVR